MSALPRKRSFPELLIKVGTRCTPRSAHARLPTPGDGPFDWHVAEIRRHHSRDQYSRRRHPLGAEREGACGRYGIGDATRIFSGDQNEDAPKVFDFIALSATRAIAIPA